MIAVSSGALIIAYVLVALLLLSLNFHSNWPWPVKAAGVVVVSAFYTVSYFSVRPLLGWPVDTALPSRFQLLAVDIQEPDKAAAADGEIYLWARQVPQRPGGSRPRAYTLDYTAELHSAVAQARVKLRKNLPQLGEVDDQEQDPVGPAPDPTRLGQQIVKIRFYDMPEPLLPDK